MRLLSQSPEETEEIGFRLGSMLAKGGVVGLYGDLGAGKTTLVKGIARAFGISSRDITSASYTVIAEYPVNPPFYHIDLYRIDDPDDLEQTGVWDVLGGGSVAVIEWAEHLGSSAVPNFISVVLTDSGTGTREITIEGVDEKDWHRL